MSSWRPAPDEELTWFKAPPPLPAHPSPLELELEVHAFTFGVSRALESLYFPMHEIRERLFDGELHLALSPSAMAERDLAAQKRRMCDSMLRFTRDIGAAWQRVLPEVEEYQTGIEGFQPGDDPAVLRRLRANQWFAPMRAVFAPTALLLKEGIGQTPPEQALAIAAEARHRVIVDGGVAMQVAIDKLPSPAAAGEGQGEGTHGGPDTIGPPLAADAPRMYLIHDVLQLLRGEKGDA